MKTLTSLLAMSLFRLKEIIIVPGAIVEIMPMIVTNFL